MAGAGTHVSLALATGAEMIRRLWEDARAPLARLNLNTRAAPNQLLFYPSDPGPTDPQIAHRFVKGQYLLPGGEVRTPEGAVPWEIDPPTPLFAADLHGFGWLRHFPMERNAQAHARWLISTWSPHVGEARQAAWMPTTVARRLISWLTASRLLIDGADAAWKLEFLANLAAHGRYLAAIRDRAAEGYPRLLVGIALALAGACLPGRPQDMDRGLRITSRELARQILADGGHVSRNPSLVVAILKDLTLLQETLAGISRAMPEPIYATMAQMAPMLRFFRHGDGGFALFNGGHEESPTEIAALIDRHHPEGRAFGVASQSRYQRLAAEETLIILDAGAPAQGAYSAAAHAGTLSFEMSIARQRLIVNCGDGAPNGPDWHGALRATAAHSTLTIDDTSSCRFLQSGPGLKLLGPRVIAGPRRVLSRRNEEDRGVWLSTSHDGYVAPFGLVHERRLFINGHGNDVRGEDRLILAPGLDEDTLQDLKGLKFAVRFHLHPEVRATLAKEEGVMTLRLGGNAQSWQFRAAGGALALEESVYLGQPGTMRPTQQMVVNGEIGDEPPVVKWALGRVALAGAGPL